MTTSTCPGCVHTIGSIAPWVGGPARTVTSLVRALERGGCRTALVTAHPFAADVGISLPSDVRAAANGRGRRTQFREHLDAALEATGASIVHDHGIWLPTNHLVARRARRRHLLRVVSPRGMLDPWALRWHCGRKRIAWALYQRRDLRSADLLHATSPAEAETFRDRGLDAPIAVVPNGVDLPDISDAVSQEGPRVALFLSRIHPKKGLIDLVEAWSALTAPDWELWIAGPDEGGHEAAVRETVARCSRRTTSPVRFLGAVPDVRRNELLARADLFVLPTRSENFGQVIAEALAAARPVLTTTAAPWPDLVTRRAGWRDEPGSESLRVMLEEALGTSRASLRAMGANGRAWMAESFAWESVARRMTAAYAWLQGGPLPADVTTQG